MKTEAIRLPSDARVRAVRGWHIGSPLFMWERKIDREHGEDCDCRYSTPYLHSLTVIDYHWSGPVMVNEPRVLRGQKHMHVPLCCTDEGFYQAGGFYSYHPEHIERMSRWEKVRVLGVVSPFGLVAEHERGYRSDGIRIDCLWILRMEELRYTAKKLVGFLERAYQCPVMNVDRSRCDSFVDWLKSESVENLVKYGTQEGGSDGV